MEDMERYGDYDEIDEPSRGNKNIVALLLKILIIFLCFSVVGVVLFRVILFNYYPKQIKELYFNDTLTAYYDEADGDIGALTQALRAPYDDPDVCSFFCDNLIVVRGAGQLQCSVRYNSSVFSDIEEKYGVSLDPEAEDLLSFRLLRVPFEDGAEPYEVGRLDYVSTDECLMYTYYKLVFDEVSFLDDAQQDWLSLEITLNGVDGAKPYRILVYENADEYRLFEEYKLSGGEKPDGK